MIATMRVVAQGTIFRNRCVFPKEWTTFLCMAGVTGIVSGGLGQKKIVIAVVWVVAITAGHLAKSKRMTTGPEGFRAGALMTGKTPFLLRKFVKNRVPLGMHDMAVCTGHLFFIMHATRPMHSKIVSVTGHANLIGFI